MNTTSSRGMEPATASSDAGANGGVAEITFATYFMNNQPFGPLVLTPTFLKANQPFTLDWTDVNVGNAETGEFLDTVVITSDEDGSEVYRQDFDVPSLASQQQYSQQASLPALSAGRYQILVTLNSDARVQEKIYNNNQSTYDIDVETATDANDEESEGTSASSMESGISTTSRDTPHYNVPILAQPSDNTCWATVATMMVSWSESQSLSIEDVMDLAGSDYRSLFDQDEGLLSTQKQSFLTALNLQAEPPMDYTLEGLRSLLKAYGPLWMTTDEAPNGYFAVHARIIVGIEGDDSIDNSFLYVNDPADGQQYTESFDEFMRKFDKVAIEDMQRGEKLRMQVVHFA